MCLRPPPPQKKLHPILFGFSKRCISMYFLFYQRESKEIALNTAMIFTTNSTPPAACVQLDTLSGPWTRLVLLGFTWKSLGTTCQHFFGNSGPLPFAYCSLEPQSPSHCTSCSPKWYKIEVEKTSLRQSRCSPDWIHQFRVYTTCNFKFCHCAGRAIPRAQSAADLSSDGCD